MARRIAGFWRQWVKNAAPLGGIAAAGDVTAQYLVNRGGGADAPPSGVGPAIDQRRVASIATFSLLYGGIFQRYVYQRFDAWFGVQAALSVVSKKVAADTFVHAPLLYLPCYFVATGLMQGKPLAENVECLRTKFADTMLAYLMIWPGAMFAIFWAVPEPRRVLFIAACAFMEKGFYSWIQLRDGWKDAPGQASPLAEVYTSSSHSADLPFSAIGGTVLAAGGF